MPGRDALELERDPPLPVRGGRADVEPRASLAVRGVRKRFHGTEVLRGVDFEVARGEVVALVGPNGAGKSTLLRIIVGTVRPDAGDIHVGGHDLASDSIHARASVSWVLGDEHGWYWRLTGLENLAFFAMLRGVLRHDAAAVASAQLNRQGLATAADQRVAEYSTGMRARLALARASLVHTPVLVLDEPGRGLDTEADERLVEFLADCTDTAVLLVTHDLEMVSRVASHSLVMHRGKIDERVGRGTPPAALAAKISRKGAA